MTRKIYCIKCGEPLKPLPMEDVYQGFERRRKKLSCTHSSLQCDLCNTSIFVGDECVAETMWRGEEPTIWEIEYGTVI